MVRVEKSLKNSSNKNFQIEKFSQKVPEKMLKTINNDEHVQKVGKKVQQIAKKVLKTKKKRHGCKELYI